MELLINHLTRMDAGYICVAGLDISNAAHVRPVLRTGRLSTSLLAANGGLFDVGTLVDVGTAQPAGSVPEVEDHLFDPTTSRLNGTASPDRFWKALQQVCHSNLASIFGPDLQLHSPGMAVDEGKGGASLGCFRPDLAPRLYVKHWFNNDGTSKELLRITAVDGSTHLDLSVTDLRFYMADHRTLNIEVVDAVAQQIAEGNEVILGVGLARAWTKPGDSARRHWLQVNNLHRARQPVWQMGQPVL